LAVSSAYPIRRYEAMVVISQKRNTARRWSDETMPSIAPAKATMVAAKRVVRADGLK
jgi:hypothetical protein